MSTLLLRQVRRAVAAVFVLGAFAALVQLALPLAVLHVIDSALPARSLETLALLALLSTAAFATLVCVNAARARILLYAGLWIEHALGAHWLQQGLAQNCDPEQLAEDASALARLRQAASDGALLSNLDAPWQIMGIGVLALIDWRLGVIAAAANGILLMHLWRALPSIAHAGARWSAAADRTQAWWHALARAGGPLRAKSVLAAQWEGLHREEVADGYALLGATAVVAERTRLLRALALAAGLATCAWLVVEGSATLGAAAAAALLLWRALQPTETLVGHLPALAAARAAWTHVCARCVEDAATAPAADAVMPDAPRLRIAGPVLAGCAAVTLFFVLGIGAAATTRLGDLAALTGKSIFETNLTTVFPSRKGVSAQVFVVEGAHVAEGDLLATLDTRLLDGRIAALRLKAATAQIELKSLHQDLAVLTQAPAAQPKNRGPFEKLEARIAELSRLSRDLVVEIAAGEDELSHSRIVAPMAGRIVSLDVRPGMPVETDVPLATLVATDATVLDRLVAPLALASLPQKLARLFAIAPASAQQRNGS